jgi:hypothetical protein
MEPLREIPGPAGALEARLDLPTDTPRAVAVIAHPHTQYGGTLQTRAIFEAARAFTRIGVAALRFNFRGAGISRGDFDEGRGEQDDYRAASPPAPSEKSSRSRSSSSDCTDSRLRRSSTTFHLRECWRRTVSNRSVSREAIS